METDSVEAIVRALNLEDLIEIKTRRDGLVTRRMCPSQRPW
jgi:hypothetical protein